MKLYLFINGKLSSPLFFLDHLKKTKQRGDFIICANGGYELARQVGIKPDVIVGDLDSIDGGIPEGIKTITYPQEKDFSDFEIALKHGMALNPKKIIVYGGLGGRKDHELMNLILLAYCPVPMSFIEESVEVYNIVAELSLSLENRKGSICSLCTLSSPCRVKEMRGFKYQMSDEELIPSSRGVSNVIMENEIYLKIVGGSPLLMVLK